MRPLKEKYQEYLEQLTDKQLPITKKMNEKQRSSLTNHRSISGINSKNKTFCYTPIATTCKGAILTDVDGNVYDDISMGFGVHLFGHHPKFIIDKIAETNAKPWGLGPYHSSIFQLAQNLCKLTQTDRVSFFNSGTEAIMVAIRLARAYTGKNKIVIFKGAYHGHNNSTLVFKTSPMTGLPQDLIPGIPASTQSDTYLLDFDDEDSLHFIEKHAHEIAAVLNEPVQSRHPDCQPRTFHQQLRGITEKHNIALIFDEMITGFRIHPAGAQAHFGIQADLVTYGKIIGGGMPIGVVAGKAQYLDMIDGGQWSFHDESLPQKKRTFVAGTFCNHPLSMAAAQAVVEKMQHEGETLLDKLNTCTQLFASSMNTWMQERQIPIKITHFGSLFRIEAPTSAKLFYHHLILEGLYVWEGKTSFLSTAHDRTVIERIKHKLKKCALIAKASGYFSNTIQKEESEIRNGTNKAHQIAQNIGLSLNFEGIVISEFLQIAIRYVCLSHQALNHINLADNIRCLSIDPEKVELNPFQEFIDRDIYEVGLTFLLLTNNNQVSQLAIIANSSKIDGWSLSLISNKVMETYIALKNSEKLPDYQEIENSLTQQNRSSGVAFPCKRQRTYLDFSYPKLKKRARSMKASCQDLLMASVALACHQTLNLGNQKLVIGTPVAQQVKLGQLDAIGSHTTHEAWEFATNNNSLETCITSKRTAASATSLIFNLDRVISTIQDDDFSVNPSPIDPSFSRYDLVINILANRKQNLCLDVKYRTDLFKSSMINHFIRKLNQLLIAHYAAA